MKVGAKVQHKVYGKGTVSKIVKQEKYGKTVFVHFRLPKTLMHLNPIKCRPENLTV